MNDVLQEIRVTAIFYERGFLTGVDIKVMTYNIHHGVGADKKLNLERIARVIELSRADIVGLNEVDICFSKRSAYTDQVKWLGNRLRFETFFAPAVRKAKGRKLYGNALLTRFPLRSAVSYRFAHATAENRSLLEAELEIGNIPVRVFVTHLSLNPIVHQQLVHFLLKKSASRSLFTIVLGDFNLDSRSRKLRPFTRRFSDALALKKGEETKTYPSFKPKRRLDYIFFSKPLQLKEANIVKIDRNASDHLPVLAKLTIAPPSG